MISCLAYPLIGGVIGYITNDIAIRMLFRPRREKRFFGYRIPFTPGLIPKEKGRIAAAVGGVISENLMNPEVLERYLLSEDMMTKVYSSVERYFASLQEHDETVRQYLLHFLSEDDIQSATSSINANVASQINDSLSKTELGNKVAHIVVEHVVNKLSVSGGKELLLGIGGMMGGFGGAAASLLSGSIIGKFLGLLREPTENLLAKNINEMLQENGQEIVGNIVDDEVEAFLDQKVSHLLSTHSEQIERIPNVIASFYTSTIREHLPRILGSINISRLVEERINEMDVVETETLILQVMDKELKAIVWLGAGLGAIMGCLNMLI